MPLTIAWFLPKVSSLSWRRPKVFCIIWNMPVSMVPCTLQAHLVCGVTSAALLTFAFHHLNHSTHSLHRIPHLASRLVKMTSIALLSTGPHLDCVDYLTFGHLIMTRRWSLTATRIYLIYVALVGLRFFIFYFLGIKRSLYHMGLFML